MSTEAPRHVPVVVVGAGQAGLSASWYLTRHGVEHLVLEFVGRDFADLQAQVEAFATEVRPRMK